MALIRSDATASDAITYLYTDHLGSSSVGTDASGALLWKESYTLFGESILSPTDNDDLDGPLLWPSPTQIDSQDRFVRFAHRLRSTGHIRDSATGLNYMQARYQDPIIGRFLSVDPVTFLDTMEPGMFNRYAYANNDPINYFDPDGEWFWPVAGAVIGAGASGYSQSRNLPANNNYIGGRVLNTISVTKASLKGAALGVLGGGAATATAKVVATTGSTTGALGVANSISANGVGGGVGALTAYTADVATDDAKSFDAGEAIDATATGIAVGVIVSGTGHAVQGAAGTVTKEGSKLPSVAGAAASLAIESASTQVELEVAQCTLAEEC